MFGGPRGLPSDFSYSQKQFCDDDNTTYTPTPKNPGGTWSISPALSGFNTSTGAFSPYGITGTFVVSHTFDGKTSTQTIVLNDSDVVSTFTYPNSAYPQSGVNPTPTITGSGPGINTGTFSATPAGLSINAATGEIDLSESALNSYVITYTSGSEFCADTATFTLEVEDPYVGFKFRIVVPAGSAQTLALETVNGASTAPNSVINWGDGTGVQALTTTTASNSFPTGTYDIEINAFDSTTPVDNFSVTSGEALVTEVIDWGGTPWYSLGSAFENCVNLTTFGTGTFKGLDGVDLTSCFEGCTSLISLDLSNWDITGGSTMNKFAFGCSSAQIVDFPSSNTPISGKWSNAFELVGSSLTDGCDFKLDSINFTGSTAVGSNNSLENMFKQVKIKPSSKFTNWVFDPSSNAQDDFLKDFFINSIVTGTNSTLDVSGWTTCNVLIFQSMFEGINSSLGNTNLTIDVTGLNVSSGTNFREMFKSCMASNITGLSGWSAPDPTTGGVNLYRFMQSTNYLKLTSTDNLSNAFMSTEPSTIDGAFRSYGSQLTSAEGYGVAPNLASMDLSVRNPTALNSLFKGSRMSSNVDFSNVTFPTILATTTGMFGNVVFSNSDSEIKISGTNILKTNSLSTFASGSRVKKITLENGKIDTSLMVTFASAFSNIYGSEDLSETVEITLPSPDANGSWNGFSFASCSNFANCFIGTFGTGSPAGPSSLFESISSCQVNNLLRVLNTTQTTPITDTDIVLDNCKYSGPQALVSNDYSTLISNGWTFGTLASEDPYFTLSSYSLATGSESTATINASYTGGTFTSSNTAIATVNASTGTVTTGADSGTCQIRYTLADGVCYNEVNLAVTIPLIANNFSFNFDGINDYLSIEDTTISNELTISIWLNPADITDINLLGNSTNSSNFLYINPSSQLNISSSNFSNKTFTNTISSLNTWQHIVLTRDSSNIFRAYKDGLLTDTASTSAAGNFVFNQIGRFSNVNSFNFNGKMDELAIWNTPLTGPQILDIYNGRLGVQNETVDLSKYANLGGNLVYWNRMGD